MLVRSNVFRSFYWMYLEEENKAWIHLGIILTFILSCYWSLLGDGASVLFEKKVKAECRWTCCLLLTFPAASLGPSDFHTLTREQTRWVACWYLWFQFIQVPMLDNRHINWKIKSRQYVWKYLTFPLQIN